MNYIFDANTIISGRNELYCADVFPDLWKKIEIMIADGDIYVPEQIIKQVSEYSDDASIWLKLQTPHLTQKHPQINAGISNEVARLANAHPRLENPTRKYPRADLIVIACASVFSGIVVTLEKDDGSVNSQKIPGVCRQENIECFSLYGMMSRCSWIFS